MVAIDVHAPYVSHKSTKTSSSDYQLNNSASNNSHFDYQEAHTIKDDKLSIHHMNRKVSSKQ